MYFFNVCGGLDKYRSEASETPWAVVTGGSDGIGLAFAEELVRQRFHVLIVGRSRDKLAAAVKRLQAANPYHVQIEFTVSEASDISSANVSKVAEFFRDKADALAILVNNVGCILPAAELKSQDSEELVKLIDVNCTYPTLLTRSLIPFLQKRKRSCIVNLSSISAYLNTPYFTAYSASKAFNSAFSRALSYELCEYNIDVLSAHPGYTVSNMVKLKPSLFVKEAAAVARGSLAKTTWLEAVPNFSHYLQCSFYQCICSVASLKSVRRHTAAHLKETHERSASSKQAN